MKNLLSVNNYYYPRGGADSLFLRHNQIFEENGWNVIPFSMRHPNNLYTEWSKHFISEIEFGHKYNLLKKLINAINIIYSYESMHMVNSLIKQKKFDICHCHNIYHHISPSILTILKKNNIPVVMTLHDLKLSCPNYQMLTHDGICERCKKSNFFNVLVHKCIKNNFALSALIMIESYIHHFLEIYEKNIDFFIVPSYFYIEKFCEWGLSRNKLLYIPNYIESKCEKSEIVPGKTFLYFGRLSKEKGLLTLLKASKMANIELIIAGDGPDKKKLECLSSRLGCDAHFLGYLTGRKLEAVIKSCRATVLPSEWYENAPLSIKESYAFGKPVIGARIGGIPELINENETGFTFESGSASQLADALNKIKEMKDHQLLEMGYNSIMLVKEKFNKDIYFHRISCVYNSLMT
jgi:glycosyltransferase involved in cell wall biosynthesis